MPVRAVADNQGYALFRGRREGAAQRQPRGGKDPKKSHFPAPAMQRRPNLDSGLDLTLPDPTPAPEGATSGPVREKMHSQPAGRPSPRPR